MKTHTKTFQESYSFSRELHILTDLHQKAMSVPRVLSANNQTLSITMNDAGIPADTFTRMNRVNCSQIAQLIYQCIDIAVSVSKAGVLHLDLAPRNFLVGPAESPRSDLMQTVTLIDFSVSVAQHFPLQKPLWLKPNSAIHHPALIKALKADWAKFFQATQHALPADLEADFSISQSDYGSYWSTKFNVEQIKQKDMVLGFGLHHCMQGLLGVWDGPAEDAHRLRMILASLRLAKSNQQALDAIEKSKNELAALINNSHLVTPVPRFTSSVTPVPEFLGVTDSGRRQSDQASTAGERQAPAPRASGTGTPGRALRLGVFALPPLLSFYVLDIAYRAHNLSLSATAFAMVLLSVLGLLVLGALSFRNKIHRLSTATLLLGTHACHVPLVFAVVSTETSPLAQLVTAAPIVLGTVAGLAVIYRQR